MKIISPCKKGRAYVIFLFVHLFIFNKRITCDSICVNRNSFTYLNLWVYGSQQSYRGGESSSTLLCVHIVLILVLIYKKFFLYKFFIMDLYHFFHFFLSLSFSLSLLILLSFLNFLIKRDREKKRLMEKKWRR